MTKQELWERFEELLRENEDVLIRLKNADNTTYTKS